MPDWAVSTLKWVLTLLALALVVAVAVPRAWQELRGAVAIDFGSDVDAGPTETAPAASPPPLEAGEERAVVDLAVREDTVVASEVPILELSADAADQMIMGFPVLPTDTACLTSVTLEVWLHESTPTRVLVRPAQLADPDTYEDGDTLPADTIITGTEHAPAVTDGSPGWLRWNITGVYALAARSAADGQPAVLSLIHPPDADEAERDERRSVFGRVGADGDVAPRLSWAAIQGCADLDSG